MAEGEKDRVADGTLARSSMPDSHPAGLRPGALFVRLWTAVPKRLDCRHAKNTPPLLSLVLDLIRSSGGISGPDHPDFVSANFPDVRSGMLCARRIQWAIEGLSEFEPFGSAAAAIVVDDGGQGGAAALEGADPGKILLGLSICEVVEGLPGMALGDFRADGRRELSWKSSQLNVDPGADEQAVLAMIQAAGRQDPAPPIALPLHAARVTGRGRVTWETATPVAANVAMADDDADGPALTSDDKSRMPIFMGAGALLLAVIALVLFLGHKAPQKNTAPQPSTAPAQSIAPADTAPISEARGGTKSPAGKQTSAKPALNQKKAAKAEAKLEPKVETPSLPQPAAPTHCDLTEQDIQRALARADNYMHGGDLPSARAAYQHVLGCPSAHEKAQQGLTRIQRMAAQNGSPDQ